MKIPEKLEMPAPTAWPIVMAFGLTLVSAGFVTAASVSFLGVVLAIAGAVGSARFFRWSLTSGRRWFGKSP
jgi:hypothetical protein